MKNFYLGLKFAFSYFSVLPIKFKKEDDLSSSKILAFFLFSFPFVGIVLAVLSLFLFNLLDSIVILAAITSAIFYMVLYGFIHTEAILDVIDALYAKHSGKDAYKVIKEPTIGAMGFLYALVFVLLKITFLAYVFYLGLFFEFVAILIISRLCVQFTIYNFEFKSSFVQELKKHFSKKYFYFSLGLFSFIILVLTSFSFIYLLIFSIFCTLIIASIIKKKLGFLNGDALGVILELMELILLFMLVYFSL